MLTTALMIQKAQAARQSQIRILMMRAAMRSAKICGENRIIHV